MDLPFSSLTGWISCSMATDSAAVASHLASARLGMPIHDGEARVSFLSSPLVHFFPPSISKLIGTDELESQLNIVRQVIHSVICPCVILTVCDGHKVC